MFIQVFIWLPSLSQGDDESQQVATPTMYNIMTPDDISVLFSLFVNNIRNDMTWHQLTAQERMCGVGGDTDTGIGSLSLSFNYTPLTYVEYLYNLELGLKYFLHIFIEGMYICNTYYVWCMMV